MTATDVTDVPYLPRDVAGFSPRIGMIGCGGISGMHLAAYRAAGYQVVALCDIVLARAEARRDEFYPSADVYDAPEALLARDDIEIVDIATHADIRPALVTSALTHGKHVLSQKPFVRSLADGDSLIALAEELGLQLSVNQNGRWAPHFAYLLSAVRSGLIGTVTSADFAAYWAHDVEFQHHPVFSQMHDLVLYDFGIHWFDVVARLFAGRTASRVSSTVRTTEGQLISAPTSATALIDYDGAQASVIFRAASHFDNSGSYRVEGTQGVISHEGASLGGSTVTLRTAEGTRVVELEGDWWSNGMHGTMSELIAAVHSGVPAENTAANSLDGLRLCFAAIHSSRLDAPVDPRTVGRLDAD
jgi:predicted dehydrogenase